MQSNIRSVLFISCLLLASPLLRAEANDFDERPVPVKSVAPAYPADMKREGQSGMVTVKVIVDENGDVVSREVAKSTRSEFETAALEAVGQWKFKPAKKAGHAVKVAITIPIKFSAEG
jgi:protein TonB